MDPQNRSGQDYTGELTRALVVDDNLDIANLMAELLGKVKDVDVVAIAIGGDAGLELATAYQVDLVLTDIDMPGTNGLRLAALLRERLPKACIILTSGHDLTWAKAAVVASADLFIPKPELAERLSDEIEGLRKKGELGTRRIGLEEDEEFRNSVGGRLKIPPLPRQ